MSSYVKATGLASITKGITDLDRSGRNRRYYHRHMHDSYRKNDAACWILSCLTSVSVQLRHARSKISFSGKRSKVSKIGLRTIQSGSFTAFLAAAVVLIYARYNTSGLYSFPSVFLHHLVAIAYELSLKSRSYILGKS
jgi:hypothetical protein